jgi:peptidylprolyl isomerase domain and WD repeat-containing protein 1
LAASENPVNENEKVDDPILFATAFKKPRFFLLTRREPEKDHLVERDVLNERPSKDDLASKAAPAKILPKQAILRTTVGDIVIKLLPEVAPLAVENFTTHAKNSYYDNLIFHRIIKGFMVQTGDPFGDGTGGESIWGHDFRDEIQADVKHDIPFTVSMANAGPNTNGSQFFITTVKCPWLDGKHSIFGRVVRGSDVVSKIESVKCDELDKPLADIKILEIDVMQ